MGPVGSHFRAAEAPVLREEEVAFEHCRRSLRGFGPHVSLALAILPPVPRDALAAVLAFRHQCESLAYERLPFDVRLRDLTNLRVRVFQTFDGHPVGPVLTALAHTVTAYQVPLDPFLETIDGFVSDIQVSGYATFEELRLHCARVAGPIGAVAARILGARPPEALMAGADLAAAAQLCAYLARVRAGAATGHAHVPAADLAAAGCSLPEALDRARTPGGRALVRLEAGRVEGLLIGGARLGEYLGARERVALRVAVAGLRRQLRSMKSARVPSRTAPRPVETSAHQPDAGNDRAARD